jgi:Holliday junction resolvase RusA-like endonuclease
VNVISPMPLIDTSDAPFAAPPVIVLDLPVPPSVNKTRKLRPAGVVILAKWKDAADKFVLAQRARQPRKISGGFELIVTFSEQHTGMDLDNGLKALIDYLRRIDAIQDDAQKYLRRLTVEWGDAPEGCRVHIRGIA